MQNSEGISAGNPASQFGLYQIIIGPVHILQNSNIIDLNLFDLLSNDQIIYARFSRKIRYPPPYTCGIWYYNGTRSGTVIVDLLLQMIILSKEQLINSRKKRLKTKTYMRKS